MTWSLKRTVPLVCVVALVGCVSQQQPTEVWTQAGYKDFVKGRFGDAGANTYVSARGRIQTVNRWDLNEDGEIDLVFANSHAQAEKLDSVIYWGDGKDFSDRNTTPVPNEGSQHCAAGDRQYTNMKGCEVRAKVATRGRSLFLRPPRLPSVLVLVAEWSWPAHRRFLICPNLCPAARSWPTA